MEEQDVKKKKITRDNGTRRRTNVIRGAERALTLSSLKCVYEREYCLCPGMKDKVRRFSFHSKASKKDAGIFRGSRLLSEPANFLECSLIEFIFCGTHIILLYITVHSAVLNHPVTTWLGEKNILDPTESKWSQVGMQNGAGDFQFFRFPGNFSH